MKTYIRFGADGGQRPGPIGQSAHAKPRVEVQSATADCPIAGLDVDEDVAVHHAPADSGRGPWRRPVLVVEDQRADRELGQIGAHDLAGVGRVSRDPAILHDMKLSGSRLESPSRSRSRA